MPTKLNTFLLCIVIVFNYTYTSLFSQSAVTNTNELGSPFVQNFTSKDIGLLGINFNKIFQANDGQVVFNTISGLCFFNGANWDYFFEDPKLGKKKDICQTASGIIYAIKNNDLGYYNIDKTWPYFASIKHKLPQKYHKSLSFINCFTQKDKVIFVSIHHIFILENDQFEIIEIDDSVINAFQTKNDIYISLKNQKLASLQGEKIHPITPINTIDESEIINVFKRKNNLWICTKSGKFYTLRDGVLNHNFSIPDSLIYKNALNNNVVALLDGSFAFSSDNKGIVVIDNKGKVQQIINKKAGILYDTIDTMVVDKEGALWITSAKGVSRIEINNTTRYEDLTSFSGHVYDIFRYQDTMYFGTETGLYKLNTTDPTKNRYIKMFGLNAKIFDSYILNDLLLLVTSQGIYQIQGDTNKLISPVKEYGSITRSHIDPNRFYFATQNGIDIYYVKPKKNNSWQWSYQSYVFLKNEFVKTIYESPKGYLWFNSLKNSFYRWIPKVNQKDSLLLDQRDIDPFLISTVITSTGYTSINNVKNKVLFLGDTIPYTLSKNEKELVPFPLKNLIGDYNKEESASKIFLGSNNTIFVNSLDMPRKILRYQFDHQKKTYDNPKKIFPWIKYPSVGDFFDDSNGIVWFSTFSNIIRYDTKKQEFAEQEFETLIAEVSIGNDSIIHTFLNNKSKIVLPLEFNTIQFKAGAPSYGNVKNNKFKFFLEGHDKQWPEYYEYSSNKTYHKLPPGKYILKVKSRNTQLSEGKMAVMPFTILPPWYQTWWAYVLYALLLGLFTWSMVKWRTRQIVKQNEQLEITIADRTAEIAQKNEKLSNLDEAKSRFFANISHEFRTPLTLIQGPLETLLKNDAKNHTYKIMHRNTKRLQELINQLLDLAKLESGEMKLSVIQNDITLFIKTLASSFTSLAATKNINYQFTIATTDQQTWFDKDKLEKIINNLISNAFKFTPQNESIKITTTFIDHNPGYLQFKIEDTGIGISEDKLPYLFERFYQIDTSETRENEGSGIGLSLVKELITIYGGEIKINSVLRQGTTCVITLPVAKSLFNPNDICIEQNVKETDTQISYPLEESIDEDIESESQNTILIVEDNLDLRSYIKASISGTYKILEAEDGVIGVDLAIKNIPDIIITDIMMPKMNGEELCEKLKTDQKTNHIPIIMLTAKADQKSKIKGLKIGADAYISKPFDIEELNVRIENLISIREKLKQQYQKNIVVNPSEIKIENQDEKFLIKLSSFIEEHISDSELSVESIVDEIHMSRTQLHRKLKALTGLSTTEFIRSIRLKRAAQLMQKKADTVTQIGYNVGFSDHSYFAKCFKKQYGVSPSEYYQQNM